VGARRKVAVRGSGGAVESWWRFGSYRVGDRSTWLRSREEGRRMLYGAQHLRGAVGSAGNGLPC